MKDKNDNKKTSGESLIHELNPKNKKSSDKSVANPYIKIAGMILIIAVFGIISGWGASQIFSGAGAQKQAEQSEELTVSEEDESAVPKTAGVKDNKLFKDSAEGKLAEGGIDGEGEYHLERKGGESQNVYLTSTTVDLSKYIGKKVRVKGQTFSAQTAGWFMEVGYLEVL